MKRWITGGLAAAMLFSSLLTVPLEAYAETTAENEGGYSSESGEQSVDGSETLSKPTNADSTEAGEKEEGTQQRNVMPSSSPEPTPSPSPTPTASVQEDEIVQATPTPSPVQEDEIVQATPTPSPVVEEDSVPTPSPTPEVESTPEPTREPKDWTGVQDSFLIALSEVQTQESGEGTLQMKISFPQMEQDDAVCPGDEAVFALPVDLMEIEDSEESVDIFAFVQKDETEIATNETAKEDTSNLGENIGEEIAGQQDSEEYALDVAIAQYEITEGVVQITFTDGVAQDAVREYLNDVYGKLELTFRWKEGVRSDTAQNYDWELQRFDEENHNTVTIEIPALAKAEEEPPAEGEEDEAAPTPQPTMTPESAAEPPMPMMLAEQADEIFTNPTYNGISEERHIYWIDNNNGQGSRPEFSSTLSDEQLKDLFFSAEFTYTDTEGNTQKETYKLTWDEIKSNTSSISLTNLGGTGHWVLSAKGLLSGATVSIDGTPVTGTFSNWTIEQDYDNPILADNAKYSVVCVDAENDKGVPIDQNGLERPGAGESRGWFYVQKTEYTADIVVRSGKTKLDQAEVTNAIEKEYSFFWKTGIFGDDGFDINAGSLPLIDPEQWVDLNWSDDGEFLTGSVSIPDLEKYNLDGSEIIYYIDGNEEKPVTITDIKGMEEGDSLTESIVNDPVANWGTNTDEVYSGGDLFLTLTGTTSYTATKEWHDKDDPNSRPQVDFYLWRFTAKDGDVTQAYQTAAPVKATAGSHSGQNAQFTISANSTGDSQTITFKDNFTDPGTNTGYLPKYDPEGYRYVYISREYMSGEGASKYRTEYGKLDPESGKFVDTLPAGYNENGDRVEQDNSIYNTGTVSNVLTGTTTVDVTKNWIANAFQSELSDTVVELTLYSKPANDANASWQSTGITYRMGQDTPFIAEFLSQSYSISMPKYSNDGRALQYCWLETGVYQGGSAENLLKDTGSTTQKSFVLNQKGQEVEYTSDVQYNQNEDGTYSTEITNKIVNEVEYYVRKSWDPGLEESPVDLLMYRTNAKNERQKITLENGDDFQLDGIPDDEPVSLYYNGVIVGKVQETEPWFAAFTELARYDTDGSVFDYIVFEGKSGYWNPQYSLIEENGQDVHLITNVPPPVGDTTDLLLRKRWLDDGDEQHRGKVTFTVYQIKEGADPELFTRDDLDVLKKVELSRDDDWWKKVTVAASSAERLLVVETSVTSTDEGVDPVDLVYTDEELRQIYQLQHTANTGSAVSPVISYRTNYHRYEASYSMVELENNQFYTVTNRRLGNINIEVTKTWVDGSTDTQNSEQRTEFLQAIEAAGYELVLQLITNNPGEVVIDYTNNTVTAGHEAVPIQYSNGQPGSAIQTLKTTTNTSTYTFYNLPKYNAYGQLVSYTVKEVLRPKGGSGSDGIEQIADVLQEKKIDTEYSFTMTQSGYTVTHGQPDHQTFNAVNQLSAQKDVFFWKEWNDAYRFKQGERPDLYLSLYQVKHNANGSPKNPESIYLDRRWQFHENSISLCDFGSMPKYDEFGYEIIYYAQEKILVNKETFDYTDVYYKYSSQMESKGVLNNPEPGFDLDEHVNGLPRIGDENQKLSVSDVPDNAMVQTAENVYLIKECGIFVNELQADIKVNGKKIWANLPSGFLAENLPKVEFQLYRYDPSVDTDIPEEDAPDSAFEEKDRVATLTITDWQSQKIDGEYQFALAFEGFNTNLLSEDGQSIEVIGEDGEPKLAKYNEEGYLYTYILREEAVDFNQSEAGDVNLIFKQPTINNYAITNGYDSPLGVISVKKILDQSALTDVQKENAAVSFTLTRSYTKDGKANGTLVEDTIFSRTITVKAVDFQNGSAEIHFENLEIYAPNGSKYRYTVTENVGKSELLQGGYIVYAVKGKQESVNTSAGDENAVANLYPWQTSAAKPDQTPPGKRPNDTDDASWATFQNKYEPDAVPLYFGKAWTDNNNKAGVRPETLSFYLSRYAASQPGQNNAIGTSNSPIDRVTITFTLSDSAYEEPSVTLKMGETTGLDVTDGAIKKRIQSVTISSKDGTSSLKTAASWVITVESVDDYAPNGMPWNYKVQEADTSWPYKSTGAIELKYTAPTGDGTGYFGNQSNPKTITNNMQVNITLWKNWSAVDKDQKYTNPFGYDIVLNTELYVAAVQITDMDQVSTSAKVAELFNQAALDAQNSNKELWKSYSELDTDIKNAFDTYMGNQEASTYKPSIFYGKNTQLGSKNGAESRSVSNLPWALKVNETTYAMMYCLIETDFTLKDDGNSIYKETFTPHFFAYETVSTPYKNNGGVSSVGLWLESEAQVWDGENWKDTQVLLTRPIVDSRDKLDTVYEKGLNAVFPDIHSKGDLSVYPFIHYAVTKSSNNAKENTFVNEVDVTQLDVTKIWEGDYNNIYGTREPGTATGTWQLTFQLQRKDADKTDATWSDVTGKTLTLTGKSGEDGGNTAINSFTYLPTYVLEPDGKGGYTIMQCEYRARELDGTVVIDETGETYRSTYTAAYIDDSTDQTKDDKKPETIYTTQATNTMQAVELEATKQWKLDGEDWPNGSSVIFELKYLREGSTPADDGTYPDSAYQPFATPAQVELKGEPATEDDKKLAYYADGWIAKWQGVPKVMPGSATTGEGAEKKTIYKVFEIDTTNAYSSESGSLADNNFVITNEPTQLKVEKIVLDYGTGGTFDQKFEFTITDSNGNKVTDSSGAVYYQVFDADDNSVGNLTQLKTGKFELQNGQYVIFYGLKKGEEYTIAETGTQGFTPTYQVTYADDHTVMIGNKVTIPAEEPILPATVSVQNHSLGELTVQKKDEADKPLSGVTFTLQRTDKENPVESDWKTVGEPKTTESNGQVVFNELDLGYTYRITETGVPAGYNILKDPIVVSLPYDTATPPAMGQNAWVSVTNATGQRIYYYTDVTVTVGNNKALVAPTTGGSGVFWPGVGGLALVGLGAAWYVYSAMRRKKQGEH